MKLRLIASGSSLALAAGIMAIACAPASAQESQPSASDQPASTPEEAENVIVVSGVRQSIETSINDKRDASQIKDSINAEDIGQLANDNIAEALQRITGVQVIRGNDGEGKNVQIRGLSENNVTLNGATASGTGDLDLSNGNDRSVNFQDLPAELFSGVEIFKALSADQIEGTLGGTINLQTRAPLKGKRDLVINLSGTWKHSEVGDLDRQDANLFVQKQFLDTPVGDFGVILNFGYKEIASVANVYGGGEFADAPGIWMRMSGATEPANGGNVQNNIFFETTNAATQHPYNYALRDVNGDGVADASDVYYMPRAFQTSTRFRDDTRRSFNGTLQWKPANNLDIRFDAVITDLDQSLTGANQNWIANPPRAGFLEGGPGNVFQPLADTPDFGQTYVMTAGRLGAFGTRVGAAPSINQAERRSEQYSLEGTWEASPNLTLYVKGTKSFGKANTLNFGQLSAAIEDGGGANPAFNNDDFRNIVDFDLGSGKIPLVTFYESPFPAANWGVTSVVQPANLVAIDPGDLSYERYRYFQFQRNAADTRNEDDSFRLDATLNTDRGFFEAFQYGFRWAERSFERQRWENASETGNANLFPFTEWDGVRDPAQRIAIQRIPVDPANTNDAGAQASSQFLSQCLTPATTSGELDRFGGNFPSTWTSTGGCDIAAITDYFNMIDIRAVDPTTGTGYFEVRDERFFVSEATYAGYMRGDFRSNIGSVPFFGNLGLRFVTTKMNSTGYILNEDEVSYDLITFEREYSDWLPSANINFALSDEIIARLAYSRTLGRPGLNQVAPGLDLQRSDLDPDRAGVGRAGNPDLDPVHADNFDASLEWYYDKGSYLSLAAFAKKIDSTIFLTPDRVDRVIAGEVFAVSTFENFGGTDIKGIEIGMAHAFNYLPGILSNLGVTGNLTLIDENSELLDDEGEQITREGLSDTSYNIAGYYDDGSLSLRLAYNWRSEFTRREFAPLSFNSPEGLPEIEAARGQLDFSARYKINKNIRVTFNAVNITDTGTERYLKYPILVNYLSVAGPKYDLGVAVSF